MKLLWISLALFSCTTTYFSVVQCAPVCQPGFDNCNGLCIDNSKQLCCDNVVRDRVGTLPQCCGTVAFDFAKQICCNGTISDKQDGINFCCGNAAYSPKTNQCCNNVVSPLGTCSSKKALMNFKVSSAECNPTCQPGFDCCNAGCIDNSKQLCCDNVAQDRVGTLPQCCDTVAFDFSKQICCNGTISDKQDGINFCCGNAAYSPKTNQCCNNVVSPLGTCSNKKALMNFKVSSAECNPTCQSGFDCCNAGCIDNSKQLCCDNVVRDRVGTLPQCCGSIAFDFAKQICCNGTISNKQDGINFCCGNAAYSPKTNQCCSNVVSPLGTC